MKPISGHGTAFFCRAVRQAAVDIVTATFVRVERNNLRDGRAYERFKEFSEAPLLVAALALIPILAIPYIWNVNSTTDTTLTAAAWFIWALFVVEYLVLFSLAPNRWHVFRTHLLDLLIIVLPFLRPLRAARSARLLRLLTVSGRVGVGFRAVAGRRGARFFLVGVGGLIVVGALLAFAFERNVDGSNIESFPDALWWAFVTATTVGYGDHFPLTVEGRAIAVVLMMVGIGALGIVTANIAAFFIESDESDTNREILDRLDRIEKVLVDLTAGGRAVTTATGDVGVCANSSSDSASNDSPID